MNNPVDCQGFFVDEIEHNREGLWCVTLQPNGQILSLIEVNLDTESNIAHSLNTLKKVIEEKHARQLLIARIELNSPFFYQQDWDWLELILNFIELEDIEFCDYLKISKHQYSSLINYDF